MNYALKDRLNELLSSDLHDPTLRNLRGHTVAMIAADSGYLKDLPSHWSHDSTLHDIWLRTVGMIAADSGYIKDLPDHW